jgi:hypothetical protein
MKKVILMMVAALLMAACSTLTPEEKAARQAEKLKVAKEQFEKKQYRIVVTQMRPLRGTSRSISGSFIKIDGDMMDCFLPYAGRDDIPHPKTHAERRMDSKYEGKQKIENYQLVLVPEKESVLVTFNTQYLGDDLQFSILINIKGKANVHLTPRNRDEIDYEGYVN